MKSIFLRLSSLRGIEIEKLSVEGVSDFNAARYLDRGVGPSIGFHKIEYALRIESKNAPREHFEDLTRLCETSSQVGDTFSRSVPVSIKLQLD